MTTTPKPRRRWFQFRLRTLFVLMLVACIGSGWIAVQLQRVKKERATAEAIERLGGGVYWVHPDSQIESRLRLWVGQLLGDDFLAEIQLIRIDNDAAMEHLKELAALRGLCFSGTQITDTSLEHLSGLNQLQDFYLYDTQVTDAGLEYLKALSQLRYLSVAKTQLTDAGLEHLKTLTQLRRLDLKDTQVSDSGVRELQKALPNCRISCQ
ncbi:MAG: leucine-rich repeat domain-containing protein [Pirellulaceae bacterium]